MLWLIIEGASHQIISCNVHVEKGTYQLWVERPNQKSLKIAENKDKAEIEVIKEAIDYAIEHGEKALRI